MVETLPHEDAGFPKREIITVGGQQKKVLPVLPPNNTLARLYPEEAHKLEPSGEDTMIMRSQASVWITRIRPKATDVKGACFACKRQAKELRSQRTAPIQAHKMGPAPPFWSMAVDLFWPLPIMGSMNKLTTGKAWGAIFVCTTTYVHDTCRNSGVLLHSYWPCVGSWRCITPRSSSS